MPPRYNDWITYATNPGAGIVVEYMYDGPNTWQNHDHGALKIRRREHGRTTHGKVTSIPETHFAVGEEGNLTYYILTAVAQFGRKYELYKLDPWGRYDKGVAY